VSSEQSNEDRDTPLRSEQLQPGEAVLLAGPAMTGKRSLLFDLLGENDDRSAVLVSTKRDADRFRREFTGAVTDGADWDTRIIDCVSKNRNFRDVRDDDTTRYVSSPGDLTGIGIAASGFMREFYHADREARIGLHTLSTLLMYADLQRVFQFSHVMTGRMEASGFAGVFTLDTTTRDSEAVDVLKGMFDAFVEVRDTEDVPELRVRGSDLGPRRWTEF
jgi:hypothetical protein